MSYYYLMSSLPDLKADGDMPLSYSEFLDSCQGTVSGKIFRQLEELDVSSDKGPLMKEWAEFYGMLKSELNYQRSMNLGKNYPSGYDKDTEISQVASAAVNAKNPLEGEKILLNYEFQTLETLAGSHEFDDIALFGYALRLRLLERQNRFREEDGKEEFRKLFTEVQRKVYDL